MNLYFRRKEIVGQCDDCIRLTTWWQWIIGRIFPQSALYVRLIGCTGERLWLCDYKEISEDYYPISKKEYYERKQKSWKQYEIYRKHGIL